MSNPGSFTEGSAGAAPLVLEARNLVKKFPGVIALRGVSFDLRAGEIHALCGENGAGKSTLIKLLSGLHPHGSYEGELLVGGRPAIFRGIADAEKAGLAVIYQELALVEELSVAENIFLGSEPRRGGFVDWPRMLQEAAELLERFRVRVHPEAPCHRLGVGEKQLVEIVKALRKNSRILILDEPTAALAQHEADTLLEILRDLRARGISSIYISHKLEEVFAVADRITVLRDGEAVGTTEARKATPGELIQRMVGRQIHDLYPRRAAEPAREPLLEVEGLAVNGPGGTRLRLQNLSFRAHAGEVLGLGGLLGAGRTELVMHLFGAWGERMAGEAKMRGKPLPEGPPAALLRRGLALVSEDRRRYGLILERSVGFNLSLSSLAEFSRGGLLDSDRESLRNEEFFRSLRIKAPGLSSPVGKLSGGNQQKVVLGRALMTKPEVIFLDEPTRGIDLGAKQEIYELIARLTAEGMAIVLVSSELPELIGLSDRIVILREGTISGEFTRAEATPEGLLAGALGVPARESAPH